VTRGGPERARILLVDDSSADIELALEAFDEMGLAGAVRVLRSGAEAIDWLSLRAAITDGTREPFPDLILLDLKMPRMDGLAVLREVKANPDLRRIPVVILTSSREQNDIRLSYEAGASSYLVKPVAFEEFQEIITRVCDYWLGLNVSAALGERLA
jgi:CheY-like chemotaxis protein